MPAYLFYHRRNPFGSCCCIVLIVQVRRQDQNATITDVVAIMANHLDFAVRNRADGVALVWVTENEHC